MNGYIRLFKQFILRSLAREKMRSAVTTLGIALGVAVMIAIRLANASALESFRVATQSIAGDTSIQITGAAGRFDEMLLADLGWLREYGQISPVVDGHAMMRGLVYNPQDDASESGRDEEDKFEREFLYVFGIDVLRDRALRRYNLIRLDLGVSEPSAREFLLLLADPHAIILTEKFALRYGISIGSKVELVFGDTRREFTVRGLLVAEGPARALDNLALLDIAAAQWAFNRLGLIDRLDLKLNTGYSLDEVEARIADRLPEGLIVARPEASSTQAERMIAAFHFNLNALGGISLLVGLFLIYNTISISVIRRREEIGILRAVGVGRRTVLALFLGEAILMAIVGTIIGLGLGRLMAGAAVRATAITVETFYIATAASESVARHRLGLAEITLAFAVALLLALAAAAIPALEASRVRPVEAMRGAERLNKSLRPSRKYILISMALFLLGYGFSRLGPVGGLPVFGHAAALSLMFAGAFLVPNTLWVVCRAGDRLIGRIICKFQVEARLASANLSSAIPRISISVAALSVSLAMMVAVSIMIGSFRETVAYWIDQTAVADIYTRVMSRASADTEGEIADEAIAMIKANAEVAAVYPFAMRQINYQENPITIGAGDFSIFLQYGRMLFKSPRDARDRIGESIDRDLATVSESFALRFDKQVGDTIELPTSRGARPFEIVAVYYDYSSTRGTVVLDSRTFARHFGYFRPNSLSIYLRPGADADEVRDRLARTVGGRYELFFTTNSVLRREVMRIFDSTFAITYALEVIAILVAALGVISTLITLILERRGEIASLSFLGATRAQIRRMIVIEAFLIGGVSQCIGILIGLLMSLVLVYVINVQSFGWTIQFHFPVIFMIQSTLVMLGVAAVAGLYPAARAASIEAIRFARQE